MYIESTELHVSNMPQLDSLGIWQNWLSQVIFILINPFMKITWYSKLLPIYTSYCSFSFLQLCPKFVSLVHVMFGHKLKIVCAYANPDLSTIKVHVIEYKSLREPGWTGYVEANFHLLSLNTIWRSYPCISYITFNRGKCHRLDRNSAFEISLRSPKNECEK